MNRRTFIGASAAAAALQAGIPDDFPRRVPEYEQPLFKLREAVKAPVKIASIELLRIGKDHFVRTRSADGVEGLTITKEIGDYVPILLRRVIPAFLGKDARDLESLVDQVYISNYKLAGQPFWVPVAAVEHSLWDLLGKTAGKYAGELMGGVIRKEIPVYLSGSGRETTAEKEAQIYIDAVPMVGAKAAKFKIGGRMRRNADQTPGRTRKMIEMARKALPDTLLYADANGSYDAAAGIEVAKWLQDLKFGFFEEPCPWEELGDTKRVSDAVTMPIAIGEQDASLWRFQWICENRVADIVQPDLNYNGGLIRARRVARIAAKHGMKIVPHNTQTGPSGFYILAFAAATPNIGDFMEYPFRGASEKANWYSPKLRIQNGMIPTPIGPGLGVTYDPDYVSKAEVVKT